MFIILYRYGLTHCGQFGQIWSHTLWAVWTDMVTLWAVWTDMVTLWAVWTDMVTHTHCGQFED